MTQTKTVPSKYARSVPASKSGKHIIVADCGTGIADDAMQAVLRETDTLILVATPTPDATGLAEATLNWLDSHSFGRLAENSITVLSSSSASASAGLRAGFQARCRTVIDIPTDPYLAQGHLVTLEGLSQNTHRSYLALAAAIIDAAPNYVQAAIR